MSLSAIQVYVKDLNEALESVTQSDTERQFKRLYSLEKKFARKLQSVAGGKQVYRDFIMFIRQSPGGIKTATPYFREREGTYPATVNAAIDRNVPELMHKVRINFQFCQFAIRHLKQSNPQLNEMFTEIKQIRDDIITAHLHIAMTKAKTYRRPKIGPLEFTDLIQIANEGLILAVDKYVFENGSSFHTMATMRMIAHLIASGTLNSAVTIGGHGNKKLYKLKRLFEKVPNLTSQEAADILKESLQEVEDLLAASSYFSLDQEVEGTDVRMLDMIASPATLITDPYLMAEKSDLLYTLRASFTILSTVEKKVLILKGVTFEDFK